MALILDSLIPNPLDKLGKKVDGRSRKPSVPPHGQLNDYDVTEV